MNVSNANATSSVLMQQLYNVQFDNYEESEKLTAFLDTIKEQLDDKIGQPAFRPYFKNIFKGIEIEDWIKEDDDLWRLTLSSAYELAREDRAGKTFFMEKELLMKFEPENYRVIFPKVAKFKEEGNVIDENAIAKKGLNAIWGQEYHGFSLYTGVGYQTTWNPINRTFVTDNINDAGYILQYMATPTVKTMAERLIEWSERSRVKKG